MIRIAVDAALTHSGQGEFRAVDMDTGEELFHRGPFTKTSVNICEALAITLALAWVKQQGYSEFLIWSDSQCGIHWVKNRKFNTALEPRQDNKDTFEMIKKAEKFLETCPLAAIMAVKKWDAKKEGKDIPADFQRKANGEGPRSQVPGREPRTKKKKK